MEAIPDPIAAELATLHRRVRWLSAVCVFLALGMILLIAYRFLPVQPELAANRFVLVDRHGRARAQLGEWGDGSAWLHLDGRDGHERVVLVAGEDGSAALRLLDSTHVCRALFQVGRDGWPLLVLTGRDGSRRLELKTGPSDTGRVIRRGPRGVVIDGP